MIPGVGSTPTPPLQTLTTRISIIVQLHIYAADGYRSLIFNEPDAETQEITEGGGGADFHITFPEKFRGERLRVAVGDANSYREYDVVLGESVDCILDGGERPVLNGGDDLSVEEELCETCGCDANECDCEEEEEP